MGWTWLKTDTFLLPMMSNDILTPEDKFDPDLAKKCGRQLDRGVLVGKHGLHIATLTGYRPTPDSGYADGMVIVRIMPADSVMVGNAEHYLLREENWAEVRRVAVEREPAAIP